jgi:hypothetical protein
MVTRFLKIWSCSKEQDGNGPKIILAHACLKPNMKSVISVVKTADIICDIYGENQR